MPNQTELDSAYLQMAEIWSQLSKALRKKVGCLIVRDGTIISDGYNGTPRGFNNSCEDVTMDLPPLEKVGRAKNKRLITKPEVIHAESNAITKLAKSTQSSNGATMYITISPCVECSKLIIQSGIKRVVYGKLYRDDKGIKLLKRAKIAVDIGN
jgi:dCMP deaminase